MAIEKSAGAVVFYRGKPIEYLLLLSTYWGFPKGQVEPGEDERTTAQREVREETGLDVTSVDGFHHVEEFWYRRGGRRIHKYVFYFLAEAHSQDVKISYEHGDTGWFTFDAAMQRMEFPGLRETLKKANDFLTRLDEER